MTPSRTDNNQREIVKALRAIGCSVQHLHTVGAGCPDLLVGYMGVNYLIEVKSKGGKLEESERKWFDVWRGDAAVAWSVDDAIRIVQGIED